MPLDRRDFVRVLRDELVARMTKAVDEALAAAFWSTEARAMVRPGATPGAQPVLVDRTRRHRPAEAWMLTERSRRPPAFVLKGAGLVGRANPKQMLVERYGLGTVFMKGQPFPKPKTRKLGT